MRDPDSGEVRLDAGGRRPGRGAYLHLSAGCADQARRRGALARALKGTVPDALWEELGPRLAGNAPG